MEKRNTSDIIKGVLIILALIGIILFFVFECHRDITEDDSNKAPKEAYQYDTTELFRDHYLRLRDSLNNSKPIKPLIITKYLSPTPLVIDSAKIINGYLELHPRDKEVIKVNPDFLVNYPTSPKLLNVKLSQDTLSLGLYHTDNIVKEYSYPIYLGSYNYTWVNDTMGISDVKPKEVKKIKEKTKWNNLYLNGGYDVYTDVPTTGLEYNLNLGRIKLDFNSEVLIMQQPELNLNAKIGYRLLK